MWSLPRNGSGSEDCQTEDSKHHGNCQEFDFFFFFYPVKQMAIPNCILPAGDIWTGQHA